MHSSIVVFVDHRPEAATRVREAAALAQRARARLTLLAAVPAAPPLAWYPPLAAPGSPRALQAACERECEALLRGCAQLVPAGVPVTLSARRGRAHAALLEEVRERGHDLVVLGPTRRGLFAAVARARRARFLRRCPARAVLVPPARSHTALRANRAMRPAGGETRPAPRRPAPPARTRTGVCR